MEIIKISVIVPVYNVEKYLKQCIDSIVNQTLKEIEIIIVNDGSTDKSREILDNYSNDSRVTIIDKENEGLGAARNTGLKLAKGEYIYFLDSDDYIELDMLEKLYNLSTTKNADIVQCGMRRFYEDSDKEEFIFYNQELMIEIHSSESIVKKYLKYEIPGYVHNKIISRELLRKNNILFPTGVYYEDILPTLKMFKSANKIILYKEALHNYRQRSNSISNKIFEKNIIDYIQQVNLCLNYINSQENSFIKNNEILCFKVINFLNVINWYMKWYQCDKKLIRNNYSKYFGVLRVEEPFLQIVFLNSLKINYKVIFILQKLGLYRLLIKLGYF